MNETLADPLNPDFGDNAQGRIAEEYFGKHNRYTRMPTAQLDSKYVSPDSNWQDEYALEDYSKRGSNFSDLIASLVAPSLRLGLLIKTISLAAMISIYYGQGGTGSFTFDLFNMPEQIRNNGSANLMLIFAQYAYFIGLCGCLCFWSFLSDSAQKSRGFRTGSKCFFVAVMLDFTVTAQRLLNWFYAYSFMVDRWYDKYLMTQIDWIQLYCGTALGGVALIFYAFAFYYLECYDDEGTYEEFGMILWSIYLLSGILQISTAVTSFGAIFSLIQLVGLSVATVWAFSFEPLQHFYSLTLHDRTIHCDLEN